MKKQIAQQFAVKNGYEAAIPYGIFGGFDIFIAGNKEMPKEIKYIGYPEFIVVDSKNNVHFADHEETMKIMGITPIVDKNYQGQTL